MRAPGMVRETQTHYPSWGFETREWGPVHAREFLRSLPLMGI